MPWSFVSLLRHGALSELPIAIRYAGYGVSMYCLSILIQTHVVDYSVGKLTPRYVNVY